MALLNTPAPLSDIPPSASPTPRRSAELQNVTDVRPDHKVEFVRLREESAQALLKFIRGDLDLGFTFVDIAKLNCRLVILRIRTSEAKSGRGSSNG